MFKKENQLEEGDCSMWKREAENAKAVIVIVHGAFEHCGRYDWLTEMWREENIHVVIGDLPGQGTSTRKRGHIHSFDDYIEEVENWVREAQKYNLPIYILGHSMGGLVVIRTLQEKQLPIEAAILSSPCLGLAESPPLPLEWVSKGLNYMMPSVKFQSHIEAGVGTRNKEINDMDENDSLILQKVSVRWYRELIHAMKQAYKNIGKFPNLPLLLFQGGEDKIVDKVVVKEWFDKLSIDEKMYKEWPGLYHEVFNEPERDVVFFKAKTFIEMQAKNNLFEAPNAAGVERFENTYQTD